MAVTRIKNNQITDSTIFANNKVAAGSIVGSLFASNLTMTSDVLITGNLQVQGATSYSTLASTNTYVNDPLIVLNNGATGANSKDIGLVFELGDDTNQMMIWDESASEFALASTSETGTTAGDTTVSAYADLHIADLSAVNVTGTGTVEGGTVTDGTASMTAGAISGATSIGTGSLTATGTVEGATLTDGTASLASGSLTSAVNVTASGTVQGGTLTDGTASLASGSLTSAVNVTASGTVQGGTLTDGTASLASGALSSATTGDFSGNVDAGNFVTTGTVDTATLETSGEATLASATISDLTSGRVVLAGTSGAIEDDSNLTYASDVLSVANMDIDGTAGAVTISTTGTNEDLVLAPNGTGVIDANGTNLTNLADPTSASDAVTLTYLESALSSDVSTIGQDDSYVQVSDDGVDPGWIDLTVDGTEVANLQVGTASIFADSLKVSDGSNVAVMNSATFYVASTSTLDGALTITDTTNSTSDTTGAVKVAGGLGVELNTNLGGTLDVTGESTLASATVSDLTSGRVVLAGTSGAIEDSTNLTFDGSTLTVTGDVDTSTLQTSGEATLASATVSDLTSGRVVLAGTSGALEDSTNLTFDGTSLTVTGDATITTTLDVNGQVNLNDTTQSTNATTGALIVDGGAGIAKDLNVGGNVVVTGDFTVNGTLTSVNSTDLTVTDKNITIADGAADSSAADGAGITVDGADAELKYVHATTSWNLNKVTKVTDATDSTSPTTGALQTAGGLGVAKDLFVGGGDIGTDQTTFNLINTTATTLNIGGAATTLELGAATGTTSVNNNLDVDGDVNVDGGDLTTNQTTFNLVNANATTVNFAGAGTGVTIGATTGTTTIQNAEVQIDGNLTIDGSLTLSALDNTPIGQTTAAAGAFTTLDSTGTTTLGATSADSIDSTPIGASTASTGAFTTLGSSGEATLASATVSDLTNNRVVIAGTSGALEDDANFTYDGTDLTVNSAIVGDLTDNRVVVAGTSGALEDDANFTWDGSTLSVGGDVSSTTLQTSGEATLASAIVSDLTATRVTYAGASGALVDSANMTFDGTDLTVASAKVSDLTSGRIVTAGTSGALEDDANLTWDGSDLSVTGGVKVSDLTSGRVTYATTSGQLTDSANMTFDGTDLTVASAKVSDLTSGRVTFAGTSGALTDDSGFEYNAGTDTLTVVNVDATQVDAGNLTLSGNNITGSNGEVVVNDAGADVNFRVEGDTETNLLVVDAGSDSVLIGTATATTEVAFKVGTTDSIMLPVGATGDRPATGVAGMLRYNSTTNIIEFYNGTDWQSAQGSFTVIATESFNGDDSTTAFTLSSTQTTASCIVSINGIVQLPTTAYGVSGTTLTFTEAPATGDVIEVRQLTTTTTVTQLADSTSSISVSASDGVDIIVDQTGVTVGTSATTVDSFATSAYRMAKYVLMAENAAGDEWEAAEAIVVHDGTTATLTVYGVTATGADSWTYSATISGGNVLLQATAGEASTTVKFQPTYIRA